MRHEALVDKNDTTLRLRSLRARAEGLLGWMMTVTPALVALSECGMTVLPATLAARSYSLYEAMKAQFDTLQQVPSA